MNIPGAMLRSVFSTRKRYDPHALQAVKLEEENGEIHTDAGNQGFKPCRCCLEIDVSTSPFDTCIGCLTKKRQALAAGGCSFTEINSRINEILTEQECKRSNPFDDNASEFILEEEENRKSEKRRARMAATISERLEKWKRGILRSMRDRGQEGRIVRGEVKRGVVYACEPYTDSMESLVVVTVF